MSENLKKQLPRMKFICEMRSLQQRVQLLKAFSKDEMFCKAVREICRNAVEKRIPFTDENRRKLLRYRKVIMSLAQKKRTKMKRHQRGLIHQTGTGIFLPIVIPLVAEIVSQIIRANT